MLNGEIWGLKCTINFQFTLSLSLSVAMPSNEHRLRAQMFAFLLPFLLNPHQFEMPLHNFPSEPPNPLEEQPQETQFFRVLTSFYAQIHFVIPFISVSRAAATLPYTKIWAQLQRFYTKQLDQHVLEKWAVFMCKIDF